MLHGQLFVGIMAARNLPDMESWLSKLVNPKDVTDAYVDVKLGSAKLVKTSVINNSLNPEWNEEYRIEVCHRVPDVECPRCDQLMEMFAQIDSEEEAGLMWGDVGCIYLFCCRRHPGEVRLELQCH